MRNRLNGIRTTKVVKNGTVTIFVPLPSEHQVPCGGCNCKFCKAHPELTPMWDTLAVSPDHEFTWTVHYPELQR